MSNEDLIKSVIIFGGGVLVFAMLKPKDKPVATSDKKQPFEGDVAPPPPSRENAEIVADAYQSALMSGEPPSRLTELNKECIKDYGMRCFVGEDGNITVVDTDGKTVI